MQEIDSACQDASNGVPSQRPVMEMTIPSSLDKTISPPGIPNPIFPNIYPFAHHISRYQKKTPKN